KIQVHALACGSQVPSQQRRSIECCITDWGDEVLRLVVRDQAARIRNRKNQALESHTESKTFGRWAIQLLGKAVVAAAACHSILGAKPTRCDFECRPSVVVETAHQPGIDAKPNISRCQVRFEFLEMATTVLTQPIRDVR